MNTYQELLTYSREDLLQIYNEMFGKKGELEQAAKGNKWCIYFDHCFKRLALDLAYEDQWQNKIEAPAYKHICNEKLAQVICIGQSWLDSPPEITRILLRQQNQISLIYREKSKKYCKV